MGKRIDQMETEEDERERILTQSRKDAKGEEEEILINGTSTGYDFGGEISS